MNKPQIFLVAVLSSFITLATIAGGQQLLSLARAAPPAAPGPSVSAQVIPNDLSYLSIPAMAFQPMQAGVPYVKDLQQQLLSPAGPGLSASTFVAPLMLPDRSELLGLTVFGQDFLAQGEVRVRLQRCDHSQNRCVSLAETTSTLAYASGNFETARVSLQNEVVDNRLYSYLLELDLIAQPGSGLRSVRLELVTPSLAPITGGVEKWSLAGSTINFALPNLGMSQARICTDDLSYLNNATHYPNLLVDGEFVPLSSNTCVTVWGRDIQIQRKLNTGPSTGTYQFLR